MRWIPDLPISHLVFIGVTAGIEDEVCARSAAPADERAADQLIASGDVGTFVDRWLSGPMFNRLTETGGADSSERLRNSAEGLASSLRLWERAPRCPRGTGWSRWPPRPRRGGHG